MTVQHVIDPSTPIGELIKAAGSEGLVLEPGGQERYALIPLDDDLLDYLIERSPKFSAACREIRERMRGGESVSHADVRKLLS